MSDVRTPGHMWLERGANRAWGWAQVGVAMAAVVIVSFVVTDAETPASRFLALAPLWAVLLAVVIYGFVRAMPRRFFAFRWTDIVWGVSAGLGLRWLLDGLAWRDQGALIWPTFADAQGNVSPWWWLEGVVARGLISPVVEELFFRGFLLVALYTVFLRITRSPAAAGVATVCINAGTFMLMHALVGSFSLSAISAIGMALVGAVAATVVLVTGRFWGALVLHLTFSGVWVAIAVVGTFVGAGAPGA